MSTAALITSPPKPEYLLPGTRIGAYEVLDLVGRGGFGTLYKVQREGLVFALKVSHVPVGAIQAEDQDNFEARSRREMAALLSLRHPNIVEVLGFERWPHPRTGHPYIVMEFVEGLRLLDWRKQARPSVRTIVEVFRKIALALAEMHRLELFHRDLKSENILVRTADGEPIIVDFGVSRPRSSHTVTRTHHVVGTYSHLSPEFCEHCRSDAFIRGERFVLKPTVEIHTVGFMLYQALTGRPPYKVDGNDFPSVLQVITETVPQRPILLNPYIPEALDALTVRLLAKDPSERPQTAGALAEALERLLPGAEASWDKPLDVPLSRSRSFDSESSEHEEEHVTERLASIKTLASRDVVPIEPEAGSPVEGKAEAEAAPVGEVAPAQAFVPPTADKPEFQDTSPPGAATKAPTVGSLFTAARERYAAMVRQGSRPGWKAWALGGVGLFLAAFLLLLVVGGKSAPPPRRLLSSTETQGTPSFPISERSVPAYAAPKTDEASMERGAATTSRTAAPLTRSSRAPAASPEGPSWLVRAHRIDPPSQKTSTKARKLGVPYGTHLRARLRTNLDSRTVSFGAAEAVLVRPVLANGQVVLPAQTRLFGQARSSGDRFTITFDRLRLPGDLELPFRGHAEDPSDENKPGLPPSRRIAGEKQRQPGVAAQVAKGTAQTVLSQVTGDLGRDVAREAGEQVLDGAPTEQHSSGDALLLDAGAEFGIFVEEAF